MIILSRATKGKLTSDQKKIKVNKEVNHRENLKNSINLCLTLFPQDD